MEGGKFGVEKRQAVFYTANRFSTPKSPLF
jgi:hypothetical protein